MKHLLFFIALSAALFTGYSCTQTTPDTKEAASGSTAVGQSGVQDDVSQKNIVQVAVGSKDHTTLVAAIKAASLVDVLSNAGPFTVFAPTDEAFSKVPKETLDNLMKPENKDALSNILEYHTFVGVVKTEQMRDGQKLNQVNLKNITLGVKDGKVTVNGVAHIIASVPASNGIVHVIDAVLLPPEK
ncbi:MAG: fasciclin domain-containing protein [Saprospiraceae bacterium]|nr:fasciclin domain-containing protein [Saprospiraceae bacterium]